LAEAKHISQAKSVVSHIMQLVSESYMPYAPTNSVKNRFRVQRFRLFKLIVDQVIADKGTCRILDVGGTSAYWKEFGSVLDWDKVTVCTVNVLREEMTNSRITSVAGDARDMSAFSDLSFDIVHSNSVIEHVGRWDDMALMAKEVRRLAPRYFVQTPYFWFPIEPHARFPLLHWMPESWRYRILMRRSCGYWKQRPDVGEATKAIQSALLLDNRQLQFLFPDAKIVSERFIGFKKSLIAIR
jgi:hypothetical protein